MKRWLLLGGVAVVVAVGAVFGARALMESGGGDTPADGDPYVCQNPSCKHEFTLTGEQIAEHHRTRYGAPLTCPKCTKPDIVSATRCPTCKRLYAQQRTASPCPYCNPAAAKKARPPAGR